jgi:hypothetical protein
LAQRFEPLATELFMLSIDLIKLVWLAALLLIMQVDLMTIRWTVAYWCHFADGIVGRYKLEVVCGRPRVWVG